VETRRTVAGAPIPQAAAHGSATIQSLFDLLSTMHQFSGKHHFS
jgi:hypothetical protein